MITCSPGAAVIEVLTEAMFELLEHVDGDDFITYHLLCGNETETIDNSATVSESQYVQECLARGVAPSVLLKPSNTLTDLDDLVLDEEEEAALAAAQQAALNPQVSAAAAIEAEIGFKLPDYAIAAHTAASVPPTTSQPNQVHNPQVAVPSIATTGNRPFSHSIGAQTQAPLSTGANHVGNSETAGFTQAAPEISPPELEDPFDQIPPPAVFGTPADAPKPNYAPPTTFSTPQQSIMSSQAPASTNNRSASTRMSARPSIASFTSNRKSIFENPALMHRASAGRNLGDTSYTARFQMPGDQIVTLVLQAVDSIANVKANLTQHLREQLGLDLGTDRYLFKVPGASFLTNEIETMKSLPYVHNCLMRGSQPMFIVLEKTSEAAKRIKKNNVEIGALIGRPLSWVQQDDEITSFRQSMTRLRYFERQNKDSQQAQEKDQLAGLPIHVGTLAAPTGPNNQTLVSLTLELLQVKKKVPVKAEETAAQFIQSHVEKQYIKQGKTTKAWSEFILKPPGLAEYIYGPYALHSFDYVRECIAKNKPVELMLVEISAVQKTKPAGPTSSPVVSGAGIPSSVTMVNGVPSVNGETIEESLEDESFLLDDPTIKYDQAEICLGKRPAESMSCISIWDMHRPFRLRVVGIENVSPISNSFMAAYSAAVSSSSKIPSSCDDCPLYMYMTAELYHGGEMLEHASWCSSVVPASNNPRWHEWAHFNVRMANLPRAVRVCFTAWVAKKPQRTDYADIPLAWVNMQLFDYKHELRTGCQTFKMWPDDRANPIGTTVQNDGKNPTSLYVQLDSYQLPVVFPTEPVNFPPYPVPTSMSNQEQAQVLRISESDPLYRMTKRDKQLMWKYREFCKSRPKALPKFLASVPMGDARAVQEMHRLLHIWAPIAPIDALELLDSRFADAQVREYAVRRLEQLSREELLDYLLQLVQVLKYEPYHETAFAEMLVRAALSNKAIGHHFFWYLKSEIHVPEISERFGLLLEAYLRGCGPHRAQLAAQNELQLKFVRAANMIKPLKDSERLAALRAELSQLSFNRDGVAIPLNPRIEVSGLKVDRCKYMDSKKLPLWLVFQNADPKGSDPYVIFKSGDDLRQDMLTLQMIRIMDHLWKKADLDFLLNAYGCIATGDEVGMIEVVLNSMTTAAITRTAGGATAAFREDPIDNWIRENNPTDGAYRLARDRFIYSCAGYCVATYVLGIGDRHNDNIMLTKDGRLFHIDFGHFLGNYKKKFGVKRERAPFVFTPDFAYVMGGKDSPDFNRFLDLCARAYNVLRKHANIFINLFAMMLSTGIPELRTIEDIQYLRDAFSLDLNEQQASQKFNELVYEAMSSRTTQINNAIHIWAH
jgi:phosphatidylinositol-4,5-bisphosphate 3-kinase